MQNRRLLFIVIIKLLTLLGLLLLSIVFVKSLFTNDGSVQISPTSEIATVSLDISEMTKGQIKKIRWDHREVAILFRQFPNKLIQRAANTTQDSIDPSIQPQTRSQKNDFFVYFNWGDSKNCPLYYAAGVFKDTCSSNRFDEAGRDVNANPQSFKLQIPPHYFQQNNVVFGKWKL